MLAWVQIASAVIQLIRLILDLLREDPKAAKSCSVAIKDARKNGDVTKLNQLLALLKKL